MRLVVGLTGASGAILGIRILEVLRDLGVETHLIITKSGELTIAQETNRRVADVKALASVCYGVGDIGAAPASGSFRTDGMVVIPCSMRTMSEIAVGVSASLLTRAADVMLKDRRRLVLVVRESPLHLGHLRTMATLTEMGAIIAPPVPGFYARPATVDDLIDHSVGRVLDLFGIDAGLVKRWGEAIPGVAAAKRGHRGDLPGDTESAPS